MNWTESNIARALAMQVFERRYLMLVPNCNWTGHECDLLAVTPDLRIVDIEVKISRADLKADAKKEKWWHRPYNRQFTSEYGRLHGAPAPDRQLLHPVKVWKHYYALPEAIWKDELLDSLPSPASGVILLYERDGRVLGHVKRRAKPDRHAERLTPESVIDIARLASLRMWNALQLLDDARRETAAARMNITNQPESEACTN